MSDGCGRWHRYKLATTAVVAWLQRTKNVAKKAKKNKKNKSEEVEWTTAQIWAATQDIAASATPVPVAIIRQLKASIKLRWQACKAFPPDQGHAYFLDLLRAVDATLEPLVQETAPPSPKHEGQLHNAFEALAVDDENDEDDAPDESLPPFDAKAFAIREPSPEDTAVAAIEADQFRAICFLMDLDELLGDVDHAWSSLKAGESSLVAATAVTNACVKLVSTWSATLHLELPYLETLAEIFALVERGPFLREMMVSHNTSLATAVRLVTLACKSPTPATSTATIAKTLRVPHGSAAALEQAIVDAHEASLATTDERLFYVKNLKMLQRALPRLAGLLDIVKGPRFTMPSNMRTAPWSEAAGMLWSMKELVGPLFSEMLPPVLFATKDKCPEIVSAHKDYMPWPNLVFEFQKTKRTSIPFVFATVCLLESIMDTQGPEWDNVTCAKIAASTKASLKRVTEHVLACQNNATGLIQPPRTLKLLPEHVQGMLGIMQIVNKCPYFTPLELDQGWLNPWMAGQWMLTMSLSFSLSYGVGVMDDVQQGRFVFHLYNALRLHERIAPIPVLDTLATLLEKGPSIWYGGRPTESFLVSRMLSVGYNLQHATYFMNARDPDAREANAKRLEAWDRRSKFAKEHGRGVKHSREGDYTYPFHLSRTFRLLTDMESPKMRKGGRLPDMDDLAAVANEEWKAFLNVDFIALGTLFREAWVHCAEYCDWESGNPPMPELVPTHALWGKTFASRDWHKMQASLDILFHICDGELNDMRLFEAACELTLLGQRLSEVYIELPARSS
ncbi:hypothetical protein SDRG_02650 [Saprolegnia diclina VS20]|uniref:DUF6604 domain-containing protein n=1 Tax=Saprolegnia diclina (strain VS20) TaxID=1156394 RepID=T0R135_SAPDV|nr:hypothetical protein SDRG_02650 [Saprolegnia diclina VS20]EQC39990.1 hypothetical protein SDRG_02650 [Saprolegnia diclina VS20]|eukprot:XP_008606464.1 hypothetical protein SDRG_02650 [Saprolegnia diclina VS20]